MAGSDFSCPRINGIDHRITGRRPGTVNRHHSIGWEVLHVVIDDASGLAFTELLPDERKEVRSPSSTAVASFAREGVRIGRLITDNVILRLPDSNAPSETPTRSTPIDRSPLFL
jgi:hypothetical protein